MNAFHQSQALATRSTWIGWISPFGRRCESSEGRVALSTSGSSSLALSAEVYDTANLKKDLMIVDLRFAIFFITQLYSLWSYIWSMRDHWAWPCSDNIGMHPRWSGELGVLSNKEYIYLAKHFNKHKPVRQVVAKNSGPSSSSVSASPPPCCSAPPEFARWSRSTITLEIGQFSSAICVTLNMKSLGC